VKAKNQVFPSFEHLCINLHFEPMHVLKWLTEHWEWRQIWEVS